MSRYFTGCSLLFSRKGRVCNKEEALLRSRTMPFLRQEGDLLRARRAYTWTQDITRWFLAGYILGCRQWYLRVLRVVSLVVCKDFLSFYCASPLTVFTSAIAVTLCVLCMPKASVGSKRAQKGSVNSVGSVREKTTQELSSALSLTVSAFYFSQKNTEEQISQRPTETLSQPISQNLTATFSL